MEFFEWGIAIIVASFLFFTSFKGVKKGLRETALIAFIEYVFFLYCSTVFCRDNLTKKSCDFQPFWTYEAIMSGNNEFVAEIIMNVIAFVPIGLLLGIGFRNIKWWKVLFWGGGISASIEIMQFTLQRGFSETDDLIHNMLGCVIGYGIYLLCRKGYEIFNKRRMVIL